MCLNPAPATSSAAWRPADTQGGGTLQWVRQEANGDWTVFPIAAEPTLHRIRWGDVKGDGKKELIVAPLQGREGHRLQVAAEAVAADGFHNYYLDRLNSRVK